MSERSRGRSDPLVQRGGDPAPRSQSRARRRTSPAIRRQNVPSALARYVLAPTPGGRDTFAASVDPEFCGSGRRTATAAIFRRCGRLRSTMHVRREPMRQLRPTWLRIDDRDGRLRGCVLLIEAGGRDVAARGGGRDSRTCASRTDAGRRTPDRRPAAILMADLEASSPLARRLSTAQYLRVRSPARARGGPMHHRRGRHRRPSRRRRHRRVLPRRDGRLGVRGREIVHRRGTSLRDALAEHRGAQRDPRAELSLRFGLHWGATLYIGRILTAGRSEVTALGDEVNEAARIEACATGGRTLASKSLIERLNRADAEALGLDTGRTHLHAARRPRHRDRQGTPRRTRDRRLRPHRRQRSEPPYLPIGRGRRHRPRRIAALP